MSELNEDYLWDSSTDTTEEVPAEEVGNDYYQQGSSYYDNSDKEESEPEPEEEEKEDYLTRVLKSKGVDKSRVRIENEEGDIEEWDFDDLDDDTKYGILSQQDIPLSDDEIQDINFLRRNRMNLRDFAKYQQEQAVKDYLAQNQNPQYTVDQVSDDDLFKFELKEQMPDLTDDEVDEQLNKAKENESFFRKKIQALRTEYKNLEDAQTKQMEADAQAQSEQQFNAMAQAIVSAARNIDEMNGMVLDDDDKEEVLSFLLDRDANGQSQFYKLFENPDALFKMAWFALKGPEAYDALTDYYKGEIAKARRAGKQQENRPAQRVVRKQTKRSNESDPYDLDSVFK